MTDTQVAELKSSARLLPFLILQDWLYLQLWLQRAPLASLRVLAHMVSLLSQPLLVQVGLLRLRLWLCQRMLRLLSQELSSVSRLFQLLRELQV